MPKNQTIPEEPTIKIEHSVPMPPIKPRGKTVNTLRQMQVGDSVLLASDEVNNWRSAARSAGFKIAARAVSKTQQRLWRVA